MRNLRNTHYERWETPKERNITATAWEATSDSIVCTIGPSEGNAVIELIRINLDSKPLTYQSIVSWDALCPNPDLACDEVISLHHFSDTLTSCLILAGGDVVVIREGSLADGEEKIEILGSVEQGITAASWSPDEELIAITTKTDTLVFMSRNFDGVMDVVISNQDSKFSNQVSVGWGKKETQFRGKGARALEDPTLPEKIDVGTLSPHDDSKVCMSWRGDGAFIVISTVEAKKRRIFRVYSRDGVLESLSEPVDGLEGNLCWRPSGNLIAGIQRLENRVNVIFFERNGLRHGQFNLRLTPAQLQQSNHQIHLSWNQDSTVLAVVLAEHVEFWTMNNYHWYLKQQISFNNAAPVYSLSWHPEKHLQCMFFSQESLWVVSHIFCTTQYSTGPLQDYGVIAVVDGRTIKLTPFRVANIPPPFSLHEIEITSNVIDVSLNDITNSIVVLHQTGIMIYNWNIEADSFACPYLFKEITITEINNPQFKYQQISWASKNEIVVLVNHDSASKIIKYGFDSECEEIELIDAISTAKVTTISSLSSFSDNDNVYAFAQSNDGEIQSLDNKTQPQVQFNFPHYCPWVQLLNYTEKTLAIGLSGNGCLYASRQLLARNCTSFLATQEHIIFTTTSNILKFINLPDTKCNSTIDFDVPRDDFEVDERCRNIERGSRLVTAIPIELCIILQMPRGNLETIYPRAMVLAGIRKLIIKKNYKKAFMHCRSHRVDMNILYDYAPAQFLQHVELFLNQVKKKMYIDLFLSSIREEDVTKTIYKELNDQSHNSSNKNIDRNDVDIGSLDSHEKVSKVNKICDAFLEILKLKTAENFQNIISAYVCKSPPALDEGLLVIAGLMEKFPHLVEEAVEHICFLADVNKLYDNALAIYKLELALKVVQQSQKDPREYLPFLQGLQEMTPLRCQFKIDDHLGKYAKALRWLYELDAFSELLDFTKKHSLYTTALSLYRHKKANHSTILFLYATYLESKSENSSAALAYESLSDFSKAKSCYQSAGSSYWRQILYCAQSQSPPVSDQALIELSTNLYDALLENKDFHSAATIQLEYLSSVSTACYALCKGYFFAEAFHLCALKKQPELLSSIIDPGLTEAYTTSTELLVDCKAQVLAQVPRIRELRHKALIDPLTAYEGERVSTGSDIPDDLSVAASSNLTTNHSLFTRYTGKNGASTVGTIASRATSKNRRKEERKRARGKKGSVYEEEYLVNSIERLIRRVESAREDINKLIESLIRRGMWEQARALEILLETIVKLCANIVPETFNVETADSNNCLQQHKQVGGAAVLQESQEALEKRTNLPVITPFKKQSLLG